MSKFKDSVNYRSGIGRNERMIFSRVLIKLWEMGSKRREQSSSWRAMKAAFDLIERDINPFSLEIDIDEVNRDKMTITERFKKRSHEQISI